MVVRLRSTDIVEVAARLLQEGGEPAVTTRAVAAGAGVQAPTIYRLFGDKDGLLDAVAEHIFGTYVTAKKTAETAAGPVGPMETDPLDELRAGWRNHIDFGLANPALSVLLADPRRRARLTAADAGVQVLRGKVHRVAAAGRLKVSEEHAVDLIHAAGTGIVLTLLSQPADRRDLSLADTAYEAILRAVVTDTPGDATGGVTAAAVALRSELPGLDVLTAAESGLLGDWLDRIIARRGDG